jgi:hypothetical protein
VITRLTGNTPEDPIGESWEIMKFDRLFRKECPKDGR